MPTAEHVVAIENVQDYQPRQFCLRELPCIQAVLAKLRNQPEVIVVDGYVWLDEQNSSGLGVHLYDALRRGIPVIGAAKNPFKQSSHAAKL